MRKLLLFVTIVIFCGCGSDGGINNDGNNGKNDSTGISNPDTLLWVGIFARWIYNDLEHYDGSYDTTSKIFVMCSNNQAIVVPPEQIKFQASGFCDTAAANRVKLMIKKVDSVKIITNQLKIKDREGIYKINNQEKTIRINEKTLERIKKTGIRQAGQLQGKRPNAEARH